MGLTINSMFQLVVELKQRLWALNSFISLPCLIDTGAYINCIVKCLNLAPCLLAKPLSVTLAFEGSSVMRPFLSTFVIINSLTSLNSSWSSCFIVPNLCADFTLSVRGMALMSYICSITLLLPFIVYMFVMCSAAGRALLCTSLSLPI